MEVSRAFDRDQELAVALNDAHGRLTAANDRLWTGLHPDGLAAVYGGDAETAQLEAAAVSGSEVFDSPDPLGQIQQVHWQIHSAHCDYQAAAEDRRRLAAEVGELIARLVDQLVSAGWTEAEARQVNVHELAARG